MFIITENPKPVLIIKPDTQVLRGEIVTIRCEIKRIEYTEWNYDWYRDDNTLDPNLTTQEFSISSITDTYRGKYTCRGRKSSDNQVSKTSDPVTLTVSEKPKPELTSDLKGAALTGNSVTLYCTLKLQSAGWKFYWSKDTLGKETESETHSYTIRSVSVSDGGHYRCRAGRGNPVYYTHYSDALWVKVTESPKPMVIIKPDSQVFKEETVTFRCEIQAGRDTEWNYDWFEERINNRNPYYQKLNSPYTTQEFSISFVTDSSRGKYTCRVSRCSDNQISKRSDSVTLTVSEKPKPTVSVNPQSFIYTGETVTLNCNLQSTGWSFSWYKDNQNSPETQNTNPLSVIISNEGQTTYYCKALRGNYESEFSAAATVTVKARPKPVVKIHPAVNVFIGETVTLTCDIQTGGSWKYHWYRNNIKCRNAAGNKNYTITDVKDSNKGPYSCKGTQSSDPKYTQSSDAVTLTVSESPKPVVIIKPDTQVFRGETVTFRCEIQRGRDTEWRYDWYKDDNTLDPNHTTQEFSISSVPDSSRGKYTCRGRRRSDNQISETSDSVTLTVSDGDVILDSPVHPNRMELRPLCVMILLTGLIHGAQAERPKPVVIIRPGTHVFSGEKVTFKCELQGGGDTEWTYSWYKKDNRNPPFSTTQEFSRDSVTDSDSGEYTCSGRRHSDSQSSEISDPLTLTVSEKLKPKLTSDLAGAALIENSVSLLCTLNLQSAGWKFYWKKETQSRETETDTDHYTISSVTVSDGGQYRCRAGRGRSPVYYTHYSDALWVNVIESPKPVLIFEPDKQVFSGEKVTFRCDLQTEENTKWTYYWFRNDYTSHPYQTTQDSSFSLDTQYYTNYYSGKYSCRGRRSDSHISKISDPATLTVSEKPEPELTSDLKGAALTGNSVTLYCTLKLQSAGWKFYWNTQSHETDTETHSYTIRPFSVADGGRYWCRAGRGNPFYFTHYSNALWVNVIENPKPVVIIKPDTQVFRGETVTFRCEIKRGRDTEWRYDWYKDDNTLGPKHTTQEFIISSVPDSSRGKYTCRGRRRSDNQISKMSDSVTLTVSGVATADDLSPYPAVLYIYLYRIIYLYVLLHHIHETPPLPSSFPPSWRLHPQHSPTNIPIGESPPVSLIINPSRTQHFTAESLSLGCEDQRNSTGWTVRHDTHIQASFSCSSVSGSTCNISSLSPSHTGVYWCQSESGERSKSVKITVHNGDVILDSPVHPVTEGNPLTLHCLYRNTNISTGIDFYKDESILQNQTTGVMTISSVSKSDEGFYHCKHPERGESPRSLISVRVFLPPIQAHGEASLSVLKLLSSAVTVSVYVLLTFILAVKCYRAQTEPDDNNRPYRVIEAETSF
ncbi:basement membrane-specific heparan sulfate proteoglycan core protein-like [Silurus meridionalis]|uniref:basement membrane-specific heparan sulfate proteoglycan core protein-like n=1 Tax=Silurus meridionalis TaxID=175797 RepID=UPI001EEC3CDC|nr:basement membrane-specific heparan sulfate proteoglycan core protein-like [Silurus meridionalis]